MTPLLEFIKDDHSICAPQTQGELHNACTPAGPAGSLAP